MPEIEMAALAKKGVATVSDSRQESAVSAKAGAVKRGFSFEGFLIIQVLAVALAGAYESFSGVYVPGRSFLSLAHRYGCLKSYPIIYEPNKGIWHPLGWPGSGMKSTFQSVTELTTALRGTVAMSFLERAGAPV